MGNEESVGSGSREQTIPGWGSVEFGRRLGLKALGATALVGGVAALAEASSAAAATKSGTIKIGYVTPSTGSLADFAGPDKFVLSLVRASSQFAKGITIGKTKYKIEIIVKNSQSDPSIAGQVATELIQSNGVDLIVTSSAPETTIPVSAVCEGAGIPCLSTVCPWEAWWGGFTGNSIGEAGNAVGTPPQYCSMFFFGGPGVRGVLLADVEQGARDDQRESGLRRHVSQRLGRQRIPGRVAPDAQRHRRRREGYAVDLR